MNLASQAPYNTESLLFLWYMQLYVSVDAATKDSLKAIDRPLFGDFWERFIVSYFFVAPSTEN